MHPVPSASTVPARARAPGAACSCAPTAYAQGAPAHASLSAFVLTCAALLVDCCIAIAFAATPKLALADPSVPRGLKRPIQRFEVEKGGGPLILPVDIDCDGPPRSPAARRVSCRMLLDTGTTYTIIDVAHRAVLGDPTGTAEVELSGAEIETFSAPTIRIGRIKVRPAHDVGCLDLRRFSDCFGERIDGVLGMDVLRGLAFSIDFDDGTVSFYDEIDGSFGRRVPIIWNDDWGLGRPIVRATLGDGGAVEFMVDTGGVETFSGTLDGVTHERLVRQRSIAPAIPGSPNAYFTIVTATPQSQSRLARAREFSLEGYTHRGLLLAEFPLNCLALGYLSRFVVAFDFPRNAMYIRPGKRFADDDSFDLSALEVSRDGTDVRVVAAREGGAGARAGLRAGDSVLAIDGRKTEGMSLLAFKRILCVAGRHVLAIERAGKLQLVTMELDASLGAAPDEVPALPRAQHRARARTKRPFYPRSRIKAN